MDTNTSKFHDIWSAYQTLAEQYHIGQYAKKLAESSETENAYYHEKQRENQKYIPYTAPYKKYSTDELNLYIEQISKVTTDDVGLQLHIPHAYYQNLLSKEAEKFGLTTWSYLDYDVEMVQDNELIYHYECKKTTPADYFNWHSDWGTLGGYMGEYAYCPKCYEKIHTDYRKGREDFDPNDTVLCYKVVPGKNTLFIGTKEQVVAHQQKVSNLRKQWNKDQVKKRKNGIHYSEIEN